MELGDSIAFGGLIVTIVTGFGVPFLERPMLGFDTTYVANKEGIDNVQVYNTTLHNVGVATLNNVVGSVDIDIINFTSQPFLSDNFKNVTDSNGNGFFKIEVLPPQSDVNIIVEMNTTGHNPEDSVATYIAADEWRGYATWVVHAINIVALAVAIILSYYAIDIWRKY
jgi:hypothetical protein